MEDDIKRVAETWFTVYTMNKGSEGGSLVSIKSGLKTYEEAESWINEQGNRKEYYIILKVYRKQ